ncbi:Ig-like domain-containing protein [Pseudomonas sp. RG1]|uniref:Ig-like domain-containing protein n=1 Tax=Pseudomonas sp. RG1 TaxID=2981602 RepID=UPI00221F3BD0|nr:Ig-like domain-containing protein [Pseudomonas sp. RG1]MCW0923063.1 Ig-like domain-containing protein [Pseudomonas sp. RG1]
MNDPVVQNNQNLVLNGDFNDRLKEWRPSGMIGLAREFYADELVNFMEVGVGASATQVIKAPKTPGARAGYELTFLCELRPGVSWSGESGWLHIRKSGDVLMSIELTAEEGRKQVHEDAGLGAEQPLEFKPRVYQRSLDQLAFVEDDELSFEVSGVPRNAGDRSSTICITRIDLQLKLEPLQLQTVRLDDEVLPPGQTLHLCLGASLGDDPDGSLYIAHRLSFTPVDGSVWLGTDIALIIQGNPLEAVKATPDWGVDQPLLSQWSLDCPDMGEEKSHDFTINLVNQYNTEPYAIDVSLGHHRLALREVQTAAYYPVLEYAQSVRLGVQVLSFYTGRSLDGREVRWTSIGQGVQGTAVTDEQGLAYFDFVPEQAGDFVITASVDSAYYGNGEVTHEFPVTVLATDPWRDLRCVVEEQVTLWDATGYPNRGTDYPFIVRLPADSPLLATDLSLHWSGVGHEELKVTVNPPLQQPVAFNGDDSLWTLACEDWLDGRFELSLVCSKLLLPSPRKPMSLARNKVRIADTRGPNISPVVENYEKTLMRVQVVHVTDKGAGEPVIDAFVDWQTPEGIVRSRTGSGGWASLYYWPLKALSNETITASVRAYEGGPADGHTFSVTAFARDEWKDKVRITFDGFQISSDGIACKRGKTHILTVRAYENSPLIGEAIRLGWRNAKPEIGLAVSDLDMPRILREGEDLSWLFSSDRIESTSSIFEVSLLTDTLTNKDFSCRLLSPDLHEEMTVVLDQMTDLRGQPLFPCIGAIHRYIFRTNALSPLVGIPMDLLWSGSPAAELGIELSPPPNSENVVDDSGFTWTLDCSKSTKPGVFKLQFIISFFGVSDINTMTLAHNKITIEDVRASAVDPVIGQDPAWMWLKVRSPYRPDLPLEQVAVQWTADGSTEVHGTGADGWSGFPFAPTTAGEHVVTAAVISPYDRFEERRSMQVLALEGDPWDGFEYSFDSRPFQPLGQSAEFPRRKGQHQLSVSAPAGSALHDQYLTLGMTGTGPAELGLRFEEPRLGDPRFFSEAGMTYRFNAGDLKDGSFGLRFASARLARLSPVIAMSLGQGAQVVKIADRSRSSQTLFWGEAVSERITIVSGISGRPMVGMKVVWRSPDLGEVTTTTNFYGEARIRFVPTTPGAAQLTATVGDALYSESISLAFLLHEPREIKELVSDYPSGYPGQQMTAQVLVVSASTAQPLANVEVMWEYDRTSLPTTLTDAEGKATARIVLDGAGEAALRASVKGGLAGWVVKTLWLTVTECPAAVESVVASPNPVPLQTYVSMTALIVAKEGREPMPRRKILVSTNGAPFTESFTDHSGRYQAHWRPMSLTDQISLVVKVENSDGTSDSDAVYVAVTN